MHNLIWIGIGGALGSICRYALSLSFPWNGVSFPIATFLSNVLASVILGVLAAVLVGKYVEIEWLKYLVIVGFCGGFSTFSTFAFELFKLNNSGQMSIAILYAIVSILVSIFCIWLAFFITSQLYHS